MEKVYFLLSEENFADDQDAARKLAFEGGRGSPRGLIQGQYHPFSANIM
jgi:hypothetical protein